MALQGDLTNISLFDVLQTLHQNRQSGMLVVHREGVTKRLQVTPDGVSILFTRSARPLKLGDIFVRRGQLTPQDVEILLMQQKQAYRPMGELLVESGKVDRADVEEILHHHAEDEIYDIFSWTHGTFAFHDGQNADEATSPLSGAVLDPAGLCLEAARRLDELERLHQTIPSNDTYYIQAEDVEPDPEQAPRQACHVFAALREPNNVADLRDLVGLSLFESLRTVANLLHDGLARPATASELIEAADRASAANRIERAAGVLEAAHEQDPDDREILERCIEAIERLNQPRRLAGHLIALGRICAAEGETELAIELLEKSVRKNADDIDNLAVLRDAFAECGEVDRADEISQKIVRIHADGGRLDWALDACNEGLEIAPDSMVLRYQRAKLYARTELVPEAVDQLGELIDEIVSSGHAARSRKAQELLSSCYRLLLKLDPTNEEAEIGLRNLDLHLLAALRKRRLRVQGGIAAAVLAIVAVCGLTISGGPDDEEMLAAAQEAYARSDISQLREHVAELQKRAPDSPETARSLELLGELETRQRASKEAKAKRERAIRQELDDAWAEVRSALNERPYLVGLSLAAPFLDRLSKPDAAFLRDGFKAHFEYEFSAFLDRILKQFGSDRQQVAVGEYHIRKGAQSIPALAELEGKLALVRARNWTDVMPQIVERLGHVVRSPHSGKAKDGAEAFRKMSEGATGSFASLDALYFSVRRQRLRLEIMELVSLARDQRLELLRRCEFSKARKLYHDAWTKADAVTDEQPRAHFQELNHWLASTRITEDMHSKRDEIDDVIEALAEVARLRKDGHVAAAFRRFRPLVLAFPVIQFERKYKLPYMVRSTPTGAAVYVNGKHVGQTPTEIELDIVARAKVTVKRAGFADASAELSATAPELTGDLMLELRKETAWQRTVNGRIEADARMARVGKRLMLLLASSNADLTAIDTRDGATLWVAETKLLDRIVAPPVVAEDFAYLIAAGGLLHRVRLVNGTFLEKPLKLPGRVIHGAAYDGKTLYVATENRHLVALRGAEVIYDKLIPFTPTTRVVCHNGKLVIGTAEGVLMVLDTADGTLANQLQARGGSSFLGGVAIHKNLVVAGAEDGALYAFDFASGEPRWRYITAGSVTAQPISAGHIFLPARDGYVHAIDDNGKPAIRYALDGAPNHAPVLADGFLYAIGGRQVTAFDTNAERPWWEYRLDREDGAPEHLIGGDGVIVAITSASRVIAFASDKR